MKRFLTLTILFVVLAGIFVPHVAFGQPKSTTPIDITKPIEINPNATLNQIPATPLPENGVPRGAPIGSKTGESACTSYPGAGISPGCLVETVFKFIANLLMSLSSLVLILSGWMFDMIVDFSIIKMATNIGDPAGVGGAITLAWATLRDIANMCFIFVLLYAAFRNMFDYNINNFGKTVRDIIIVALLINFSLFFSKVVIDASNIVSVGFYNSIATQSINLKVAGIGTDIKGISPGYMKMLGMQSIYGSKVLEKIKGATEIFTFGILSAVFMLILAVILLIAGIMFAARFIILIFLMILSPLALIAYIIPGQKGKFEEWKDALIAQSFFAPIYFALTWVVFKLGNSLITSIEKTSGKMGELSQISTNPKSALALVVNYVLIIGFSIAALIFSKQMATKGAVGGYFGKISGGIGAATIGGAALAGRNVIGRGSGLVSEKYRDKWSQSKLGRAGLWMADKGKKGSFDVRATDTLKKVPGLGGELDIMGKSGGKGGFTKTVEDKAKAKAQYAKDVYGQTDEEKEDEKDLESKHKDLKATDEPRVRETRKKAVENAKKISDDNNKRREEYLNGKLKPNQDAFDKAKQEKEDKEKKLTEEKKLRGNSAPQVFTLEKELEAAKTKMQQEEENLKTVEKNLEENDEAYAELKEISDGSREELKTVTERLGKKIEDNEYSSDVQDVSKELERVKNASANRLEAYASRLQNNANILTAVGSTVGAIGGGLVGGIPGGVLGAGVGATAGRGGKESARAVRKMIKGKTEEEELAELAEKVAKKKIKADADKEKAETPEPPESKETKT